MEEGQPRRLRGVVHRKKTGKWGAQIGVKKTVIWLGTYETEADAGIAYDRASLKLRRYSSLNFPSTGSSCQEKRFQSLFSFETIISMIKLKTYSGKYEDFLSNCAVVTSGACLDGVESDQQRAEAEDPGSETVTEERKPIMLFGVRIG